MTDDPLCIGGCLAAARPLRPARSPRKVSSPVRLPLSPFLGKAPWPSVRPPLRATFRASLVPSVLPTLRSALPLVPVPSKPPPLRAMSPPARRAFRSDLPCGMPSLSAQPRHSDLPCGRPSFRCFGAPSLDGTLCVGSGPVVNRLRGNSEVIDSIPSLVDRNGRLSPFHPQSRPQRRSPDRSVGSIRPRNDPRR
jgi:hypothetical protein